MSLFLLNRTFCCRPVTSPNPIKGFECFKFKFWIFKSLNFFQGQKYNTSVYVLTSEERTFHPGRRKIFFCSVNVYLYSLNKTIFHFGCFGRRPKRSRKLNTKLDMFSELSYTSCCDTLLFPCSKMKQTLFCLPLAFPISPSFACFLIKKCFLSGITILSLFKENGSKWVTKTLFL